MLIYYLYIFFGEVPLNSLVYFLLGFCYRTVKF